MMKPCIIAIFAALAVLPSYATVTTRWDDWTPCTESCDGGVQERVKYCHNGIEEYQCDRLEMDCNIFSCQDTRYGEWTECSASCGGGERTREYFSESGFLTMDTIKCNTQPCEEPKECRTDFTIVLDSSGSIGELNWWIQKQFVLDFLQTIKISPTDTRIGCVTFGRYSEVNFHLDTYDSVDLIMDHIWRISYMKSMTNTAAGIEEMHNSILASQRENIAQIGIVITDGGSNVNSNNMVPNADNAKADGITIISLGIKNYVLSQLEAISSGPEYVTTVDDFDNLDTVMSKITDITCSIVDESREVDCSKCDFSLGQMWRPDPNNCHNYFVCVKNLDGSFRTYQFTCPANLYWVQETSSCSGRTAPTDNSCLISESTLPTVSTTTTEVSPCPYVANAEFPYMFSATGMEPFQVCRTPGFFDSTKGICTCMYTGDETCDNTMLLHFPFDLHLNDVTCNKAVSTSLGTGSVQLVADATRGTVASFSNGYLEVPFMRNYFAGSQTKAFSVCLYYKYSNADGQQHVLVTNGDCQDTASFELGTQQGSSFNMKAYADVMTSAGNPASQTSSDTNTNTWHHACWVFNGSTMKLYLDKVLQGSVSATGSMGNTDVPMAIGGRCGNVLFNGLIDEVRVYTHALTQSLIDTL